MLVLFARKSRLRTFDPFRAKKEEKTKRKGKKTGVGSVFDFMIDS